MVNVWGGERLGGERLGGERLTIEMDHCGLKWPKESKTRVIQSGSKVFKVAQLAEVAQRCPKWPKVTQSGPKWTKVDQSGLIEISLFFAWLNK